MIAIIVIFGVLWFPERIDGSIEIFKESSSETVNNKQNMEETQTVAEPFIDGFAIVKMTDGKCGILQYSSDDVIDFEVTPVQKTIVFLPGETATCKFNVIPSNSQQGQEFAISIDNGIDVSPADNNIYSFSYKPSASKSQDFVVNVSSNGLLLQSSTINYDFKQKEKPKPKCMTCGEETNKCPHKGKHKTCSTCHKVIDKGHRASNRCQFDGNHPDQPKPPELAKKCPICKKPINKCKFRGNHPDIIF